MSTFKFNVGDILKFNFSESWDRGTWKITDRSYDSLTYVVLHLQSGRKQELTLRDVESTLKAKLVKRPNTRNIPWL